MRYIYGPNAEDVKDIPTAKIVAVTTIIFTVPSSSEKRQVSQE